MANHARDWQCAALTPVATSPRLLNTVVPTAITAVFGRETDMEAMGSRAKSPDHCGIGGEVEAADGVGKTGLELGLGCVLHC